MDEQKASDYETLTARGLKESADRAKADEERRRANAPPADTRTAEQKAELLRALNGGTLAFSAAGNHCGAAFDVSTWQAYVDKFLEEMGEPKDPIERMLFQQIVAGHVALSRVHLLAGLSESEQVISGYLGVVCRLMAEVRKSSLALQSYRRTNSRNIAKAAKPRPRTERLKQSQAGTGRKPGRKRSKKSNTEQGSKNRLTEYFTNHEPVLS